MTGATGAGPPRRYRAGLDAQGRSTVGPEIGPELMTADGMLSVQDLWRVAAAPPPAQCNPLAALDVGVPPGGSRAFISTVLRAYDSGLHRTATWDLSTVVVGSVIFRTETAEVQLGAGDSVIVPGVLHGWRAAGAGGQLIIVMIGMSQAR